LILSAKALLDHKLNPSREEVITALRGNLCRCAGYQQVVEPVLAASKTIRGEKYSNPYNKTRAIGKIYRRKDSCDKAIGNYQFLNDEVRTGYAFVKVVRSPYHSAKIINLDKSEALKINGVLAVITAGDIPGVKAFSDRLVDDALTHRNDLLKQTAQVIQEKSNNSLSIITPHITPHNKD
jgi:aldehyde oxidoreductase